MIEKGYGRNEGHGRELFDKPPHRLACDPTPQMLIGYMLEYIHKSEWWRHKPNRIGYIIFWEDVYSELESIIKEMDGEE
jgi:hypothetical protein